jgi:hypothetical protein
LVFNITISCNGLLVKAMLVDECDSTIGSTSDEDHDSLPPCEKNHR